MPIGLMSRLGRAAPWARSATVLETNEVARLQLAEALRLVLATD